MVTAAPEGLAVRTETVKSHVDASVDDELLSAPQGRDGKRGGSGTKVGEQTNRRHVDC